MLPEEVEVDLELEVVPPLVLFDDDLLVVNEPVPLEVVGVFVVDRFENEFG